MPGTAHRGSGLLVGTDKEDVGAIWGGHAASCDWEIGRLEDWKIDADCDLRWIVA
jgi:hypothetical protein